MIDVLKIPKIFFLKIFIRKQSGDSYDSDACGTFQCYYYRNPPTPMQFPCKSHLPTLKIPSHGEYFIFHHIYVYSIPFQIVEFDFKSALISSTLIPTKRVCGGRLRIHSSTITMKLGRFIF